MGWRIRTSKCDENKKKSREKRKMYDTDNIFKNRRTIAIEKNKEETQITDLIVQKEDIFMKFIQNNIDKLFLLL